jgi:hypothetical protein
MINYVPRAESGPEKFSSRLSDIQIIIIIIIIMVIIIIIIYLFTC